MYRSEIFHLGWNIGRKTVTEIEMLPMIKLCIDQGPCESLVLYCLPCGVVLTLLVVQKSRSWILSCLSFAQKGCLILSLLFQRNFKKKSYFQVQCIRIKSSLVSRIYFAWVEDFVLAAASAQTPLLERLWSIHPTKHYIKTVILMKWLIFPNLPQTQFFTTSHMFRSPPASSPCYLCLHQSI